MAKKNKVVKSKLKETTRKKGTYYDKNQKAIRAYQQKRRADIKAGKIVPNAVAGNGKTESRNKGRSKIVGDLHSSSSEARAIYKNRYYYKNLEESRNKQKRYDAKYEEKKRLAFIEYYDTLYPPPK